MSIEEFNPRVSHEEGTPFIMINRNVVQCISNPEAGFVWVYLRSMSSEWKVIKSHIKNHFKLGDKKIKSIFSWLNSHGLVEYVRERRSDGTLNVVEIKVLNGSKFMSTGAESDPVEVIHRETPKTTTGSKIHPVVSPPSGREGTNINKESNINKKAESTRKKRVPLSVDFEPDAETKALFKQTAQRCGIKGEDLQEKFIDLYGKGYSDDWNKKLRSFLKMERPSIPVKYNNNHEIRSTVKEWGPGHPGYDSLHTSRIVCT